MKVSRKIFRNGVGAFESMNFFSKQRACLALRLAAIAYLSTQVLAGALAQAQDSSAGDLERLSIEQLINLEVTSVSKKTQKLSDSAAAVFVVTDEDIRRSGYTSIPEVLRLVPGLDVARIDGSQWSISARGFNGLFSDKLLVLIDGRSVYTPLFRGGILE